MHVKVKLGRATNPWIPQPNLWAVTAREVYTNSTWPSANRAIYQPVWAPCPMTVTAMSVCIVSGAGGNYDLGLYNQNYTSIALMGSTAVPAGTGTRTFTFANPIRLVPETVYWAAASFSSTGVSMVRNSLQASAFVAGLCDVFAEASAVPLPSTMTPVTHVNTFMPIIAFTVAGLPS